jgi:tetratricopeptide (TPR) repeat protein
MLALAGRAGDSTAAWGHLWRFDALVQTGRVDDAEIQLDLLEPIVARLRQPLPRWHLLRSRAAIHQCRGHFAAAYDTLDEAARMAELGDHANARAGIEFTRVFINTMTTKTVSSTAVDAVKKTLPVPLVRLLGLASFYVQYGRVADAQRYYRQLPPLAELAVPPSVCLIAYAQYSEAAAACGDPAGARSAYEHLLPYARFHVTAGTGVVLSRGSVHYYLGITSAACGRTDTAIDHLRAAVRANSEAGLAPYAAQSEHLLAEHLHRRGRSGDQREARELAHTARATAELTGMRLPRSSVASALAVATGDGGTNAARARHP